MSSLKREDMLQRFQFQMPIGSTCKMTKMIGRYSLSCYKYKITIPKHVQDINLSKDR